MNALDSEFAETRSRTSGSPGGQSLRRWLLAVVVSFLPLIAAVALREPLELPQTFVVVGVVLSFALLLLVNATSMLRVWPFGSEGGAMSLEKNADATEPPAALASVGVELPAADEEAYDRLTGLPTFHSFSQRLLEDVQRAQASGEPVAVVLIDINHLAKVNDQFGAEAGDQVLRHLTACLQLAKRSGDLLARMGDDEFGLILSRCDDAGARGFVDRVEERLARDSITVHVDDWSTSVWIGICAGAAVGDSAVPDADTVLTAAVDNLNAARRARDRRRQRWQSAA